MKKTQITKVDIDWVEIKNECRNTVNKDATDNEPTEKFIKQLLISEHSPIRLGRIKWRWAAIKSWIATHFARHWLGFDKWIGTQRKDRTGVDRDKSPQDTLVPMDVCANIQALINISRFRLCHQASTETREYMEDVKNEIKYIGQEEVSNVMVPNCIYRAGCPEFSMCNEKVWAKFLVYCEQHDLQTNTIQQRYDAYNQMYWEGVKENGETR